MDVDQGASVQTSHLLGLYLAGKLLANRVISCEVLKKFFQPIWKLQNKVQIDSIGRNIFLFRFVMEEECSRVL